MFPPSPPQPPTAPPSRSAASQARSQHRRSVSSTDLPAQSTSLPSIRQLHPHLPPPGMGPVPPIQAAEQLAAYTYPAPPHFVAHPSSSSTTTSSSVPPPPSPHQSIQARDRDMDIYPMAESEIEETEQPPKKKRRRQALSCTECKRRKIKCDRTQPCGPCARRGEQAKCHWHVIEPIEKYVTRAEYDELKSRFEHLEAIVHRIAPGVAGPIPASTSSHHHQQQQQSSSSHPPPPGTVSLYHVGLHSPPGSGDNSNNAGSTAPNFVGGQPSALPTHMIFPQVISMHGPPPQHAPSHLPPVQHQPIPPPQHHASPFDQGHVPSTSGPVQAQRYDLQPHQSFPATHPPPPSTQIQSPRQTGLSSIMGPPSPPKEVRSPPMPNTATTTTKKSPLSLAAITSPTSPRQKNFHAQTLILGERLRPSGAPLSGASEGPAVVGVVGGRVQGRYWVITRRLLHRRRRCWAVGAWGCHEEVTRLFCRHRERIDGKLMRAVQGDLFSGVLQL